MMYRQIWIHPDDRKYQQILWRFNDEDPLGIYELNTVVYGLSCSPFHAIRCLTELSHLFEVQYPETCKIIRNSFYMDDLLVSVDSLEEIHKLYQELTHILNSACWFLRKWTSNDDNILSYITDQNSNREPDENLIRRQGEKDLKTLGISWYTREDMISYNLKIQIKGKIITKRDVLTTISQLFDPLGLVGPVVVKAKLLLQTLWRLKIDWDTEIPADLVDQWNIFLSQLPLLNQFKITRQVLSDNPTKISLVGFSDSSEKAYGCCIYLVSENSIDSTTSQLLCAKSRVAPLKLLSLPRLELLAAVLLAQLTNTILQILNVPIDRIDLYTDSTIVLAWLKIEPSRLKTFVANRVVKITELTTVANWKHVNSENNAADLLSRGTDPINLIDNQFWFNGPTFITNPAGLLPVDFDTDITELPELKQERLVLKLSRINLEFLGMLFDRFSNFLKLCRTTAYILRFKYKPTSDALSGDELTRARNCLIKLSQRQEFAPEISALENGISLETSSKLLNLHPFLDSNGILRVGGRLANADIDYDQKHPIILSNNHKFTFLLIQYYHYKHLHTGTQNLLAIIRLNFWPLNGKLLIKRVLKSCRVCIRCKPKPFQFLMGEYPKARVIPSRPFSTCGVDYAGPIFIKEGSLRNSRLVKTYVCIFVCFAVKAIHIELAKDLSTESFLNVLKRFISRRGKPTDMYSDNGTNFTGANNQLVELYQLLSNANHKKRVVEFLVKDQIKWHFIPPRSPHVGGLWEAAVKSTKYHLTRVLKNASVTYEEMYTILTQIEACLNSRPLSPLSNDPNDLLPLTPGHFLIGDSLLAAPQTDVANIPWNRLSRYQRMQQLVQAFWNKWRKDYLSQLQKRSKWTRDEPPNLTPGTVVVLMEDNLPPLQWPLGRIVECHPGKDKIIRVVTVKVASGSIFKRALSKICPLPVDV